LKSVFSTSCKSRAIYSLESTSLYSVIFTATWSTFLPTREGPDCKNNGLKS